MTAPTITPLPPAPSRGTDSPQQFSDKGDALLGALPGMVTQTNVAVAFVNDATETIETLVESAGFTTTSSTSLSVTTGSKTLTVQANRSYVVGTLLLIARTADPAVQMLAQVTAYNPTTGALSVAVSDVFGSGTYSDWTISLSGPRGLPGEAGLTIAGIVAEAGDTITAAELNDALIADNLNWKLGNPQNFAVVALELAELRGDQQNMQDGVADAYEDTDGVAVATGVTYDSVNDWYRQNGTAISTWTSQTGTGYTNGRPLAFAAGLYVFATNEANKIVTSPDGVTWTVRTPTLAEAIRVRAANNIFFMMRDSSSALSTSADGLTYTSRTLAASITARGVAWNGTVYCIVGDSGAVQTSPDLATWTSRTSGTAQNLLAVATIGTLFVAVGAGGTVLTSPDGATWTARTSGTSNQLNAIVVGAGLAVAAGSAGTIITSPDGTNWTARTSGSSENITGLARSVDVFVYVTPNDFGSSGNGLAWTRVSGPWPFGSQNEVASNGTGFVAVDQGSTKVLYRSDEPSSFAAGVVESISFTATAAPSTAFLTVLARPVSGSITPGTSLIGRVSRNGGANTTAVTLTAGATLDGFTAYSGTVPISSQPTGTAMRYRIDLAAGAVRHDIKGAALQWRV